MWRRLLDRLLWWRRRKRGTLVVMRLADMHLGHPEQDDSRVCSECGYQVGIYPSGQAALRAFPDCRVICQVCYGDTWVQGVPAPGALAERGVPRRR